MFPKAVFPVVRALVMAGALVAFSPLALSGECVMTVRWNDDAPYFVRGANGEVSGLNAELVREGLRRIGCEPMFVEMVWARALNELQAGRLDILPGAFRTAERERYAHFSRPANRSPNVLFVSREAAGKFRITRLSDLIGTDFRLGAQINVSYGAEYQALAKKPEFAARLVPVSQRRSAWKMIEAGRLDGLIADEITGLLELRELGLADSVQRSVVVSGDPSMIAFSRQSVSRETVDQFDRALEAIMADGTYKSILVRYLPCRVSVQKLGCE